jgi:TonB-linked SusC/RagA family outer membrane protein
MKKLILLLAVFGCSFAVFSQTQISGIILEKDTGTPLPGVSISVKGTSSGTTSNTSGAFTLSGIKPDTRLVFSFIGYKTQEILVGNQSNLKVSMEVNQSELDEVVVTALNIQRGKSSLGYSVSQVNANEVNVAREHNVFNSLTGKVAGLQISQSNTGVDGSSRILLRGVSTINGSNRPLIVVDGLPISGGGGGAGSGGGVDRGDQLSDINPNDVESISVLKGAGAAAAYGSLGMNGVILITTKSGAKKNGIGISLNSNYTVSQIALTADLQNEYGMGAFGGFSPVEASGRPVLDYPYSWSWGPKMTGQEYTNWLGKKDTYSSQGNPYNQFYDSGFNAANTIAFDGKTETSAFRFSITDERAKGIISNNTLAKQTFNLRGSTKLGSKLSLDGKMTYLTSKTDNRPSLAEGSANTALQLSLMPRDIRLSDVANNMVNANGEEVKWQLDNTFNNPYWSQENVKNNDKKDRFQGLISGKLDLSDKFNITAKSGIDFIVSDYISHGSKGSPAISNGLGNYGHETGKSNIWNSDILATYNTAISDLKITTSLGSNYRFESSSNTNITGNDSKVANFYQISNYKNSFSSESISKKAIYSYYGLGQFNFKDYLYFDATIRNDNSSALPKENNSYWYHSENMSLLFTKLLGINSKIFSKGKIRGSYAKVGNDTSPYRTSAVYSVDQTVTLPYTVGSISGSLPSFTLKPETSHSWEIGTELGFLNNRISLDFTYYQTRTKDQIMAVPVSGTTGYSTKIVNAGVIAGKGFEFQLNAVPIETKNFEWNTGLTLTKSKSIVESLNEGLQSITLNTLWSVSVEARPGEQFGSIYGNDFLRDNFGRKLITNDGYTQKGDRIKMGSINPDFYGGFTNKFRYKNLSLNTLISFQKGGQFYSYGRAYRMFFGTDKRSLVGRESGIVEVGINENTGFENKVAAGAMLKQFSENFSNAIATDNILDASNIKLREVTLNYDLPNKYFRGSIFQSASVSVYGRNLLFLYNAAEDIDPEASYNSNPAGAALEHSGLPSLRTYGVNLKVNF